VSDKRTEEALCCMPPLLCSHLGITTFHSPDSRFYPLFLFISCNLYKGASGPGGPEFAQYKEKTEKEHGVQFFTTLADLPKTGKKRLALISGRTADNPRLLSEAIKVRMYGWMGFGRIMFNDCFAFSCVFYSYVVIYGFYQAGCTCIYLEKPGAPTVKELEAMREEAKKANVPVLMGYNKNVCKFVSKAREYADKNGGHITFVSNNTYENTPESLGECFERNAEGMLKNMAIHELALLVSFYDVTVENIESVTADKEFSSCQTLKGPSGKEFTDFDKIKFTIKTKSGKEVSVQADRCGGDTSYAKVEKDGKEVFRHSMPDEEDKANVSVLEKEYPGAMVRLY